MKLIGIFALALGASLHAAEAEAHARIAAAEKRLMEAAALADREFDAWADKLPEGPSTLAPTGASADFALDAVLVGATPNSAGDGLAAKVRGNPLLVDGHTGKALRLDRESGMHVLENAGFRTSDSFTFSLWLRTSEPTGAIFRDDLRGIALRLAKGRAIFAMSGLASLSVKVQPTPKQWTHFAVSYDGSNRPAGMRIYVDGVERPMDTRAEPKWKTSEGQGIQLGFGLRGTVDEFRIFPRRLAPVEVAALAGRDDFTKAVQSIPDLTPPQRVALLEFYIATAHDASRTAREELRVARERYGETTTR